MSNYFDAREFLGDAFDLVVKHLTDTGKKYEKEITNDKSLQRFLIDFSLIIEQTIKVTVDKHEVIDKIAKIETEVLNAIQQPKENDPMIR